MSFKILSDDEKQFLDEEQLRIYNEEYELYLERNRFVDRLEALENAEIHKYEPELKKIGPIAKIRETKFEFSKPERPDVKNGIKIKELSELPDGFELPQFSVSGSNIKIAEAPELKKEIHTDFTLSGIPESRNYSVESVEFKMPETDISKVDTDVVPELKAISYETPEYTVTGTENINRNCEVVPCSFKKPEISRPVLNNDVPVMPEITELKLPKHSAAEIRQPEINGSIEVHDFTVPEFSAEVPSIRIDTEFNIAPYKAEKTEISDMPELNICRVTVPEHRTIKAEAAYIPNIKIGQAEKLVVFQIDDPKANLPEVRVDNYEGRGFVMPEITKVSLDTNVSEKPFPEKTIEIPSFTPEIKKIGVMSAESIERGIKAFSSEFNNSLNTLRAQISTDTPIV